MKKLFRSAASVFLILLLLISASCFRQPSKSPDQNNLVIYPAPPAETKIQYLTSISVSTDFSKKQSAFNKFLFGAEEARPIVKPYGITVHGSKIYICDSGIRGIEILDLGEQSFEYFIPGGKGQLQLPINCHVDSEGKLYIADGNRRQVVIFDQELNYLDAFTLEEEAKPTDIYVDESRIWVTALDKHSIYVYDKTNLNYIASLPQRTTQTGVHLYQPANISINNKLIYISDIGACKIHVFNTDMDYLHSFGEVGKGFGQFTRPKGLCADNDGNIYVVDAAFENVQIFDPEGKLLMYFGGTYTAPGGMWLPADVTIDYNNLEYFSEYVDGSFDLQYLIFVTNQYGPDKISVYGFVNSKE